MYDNNYVRLIHSTHMQRSVNKITLFSTQWLTRCLVGTRIQTLVPPNNSPAI